MKFNSQICTSMEQSRRLLALGLKKETADMAQIENWDYDLKDGKFFTGEYFERPIDYVEGMTGHYIPAWSLWRLIEMLPPSIKDGYHYSLIYDIHRDAIGYICFANCGLQRPYNRLLWDTQSTDPFDNIIVCIEWLIKEGYFSKEYLV